MIDQVAGARVTAGSGGNKAGDSVREGERFLAGAGGHAAACFFTEMEDET